MNLLAVFVLVFANGFFVAAEFALVTVRRTRIAQLMDEGVGAARAVDRALTDLDRYIAGSQVGITLASLALGWIGEPTLAKILQPLLQDMFPNTAVVIAHSIAVGVAFAIITFLHVILGELVPKSLALQKAEETALFVARPMRVVVALFRPLIWSLNGLGNLLLRLVGLEPAGEHASVHSSKELGLLVRESHEAGELDDTERRLLQRSLRFSETTVSSIMVPRADMEALDLSQPTEIVMQRVAKLKHSRFPAYDGSPDHIVGILYLQDLFAALEGARGNLAALDLQKLVKPPLLVPESVHLDILMKRFRTSQVQLAVVVDEYGGTAGIVTLEDVVECVFGRMNDHNEVGDEPFSPTIDGFMIKGDARLVEVSELLGHELTDETSDTIAGFVVAKLGRLAKVGDRVRVHRADFEVTEVDHRRVTGLRLRLPQSGIDLGADPLEGEPAP